MSLRPYYDELMPLFEEEYSDLTEREKEIMEESFISGASAVLAECAKDRGRLEEALDLIALEGILWCTYRMYKEKVEA